MDSLNMIKNKEEKTQFTPEEQTQIKKLQDLYSGAVFDLGLHESRRRELMDLLKEIESNINELYDHIKYFKQEENNLVKELKGKYGNIKI
jgi:chromosome segregation ATPase